MGGGGFKRGGGGGEKGGGGRRARGGADMSCLVSKLVGGEEKDGWEPRRSLWEVSLGM